MYSGSERSGEVQVRMYPTQPGGSKPLDLGGKWSSMSKAGEGLHVSSAKVDPEVEYCAIVLVEEYEVESAGVSKKGSLGARGRGRFVCVVDAIGGPFCDGITEISDGSGWDCDRECIVDSGAKAE